MDDKKNRLLTEAQLTFFLVGFVLGPSFYAIPAVVGDKAKQDAWISIIIALLYPLLIILLSCYIIKKHPNDNILSLSKKSFGRFFGIILNIMFLQQYSITSCSMISDTVRVYSTYVTAFLSPLKIIIITVAVTLFTVLQGLKVLAKVNEYASYVAFILFSLSVYALTKGSISNIKPVFGSGLSNILKGSILTSYYYIGFEALLIYHPYVYDKKAIKRASIKAVIIAGFIWLWMVFVTIYRLGIYVTLDSAWPFVFVLENIHIPIINNFMFIFMFASSLMTYKCRANYFFTTGFILSDITKIDSKIIYYVLSPIYVYLGLIFMDNIIKSKVINFISPIYVIFNIVFIAIIAIIIFIKDKTGRTC